MKKYTKIRRLGHSRNTDTVRNPEDELLFKEKLDGANFRWTYNNNGKLVFGSRRVTYTDENGEPAYKEEDYEKLDGRFEDAIQYIRDNVNGVDVLNTGINPENCTFFGEYMVKHSLEYNWEETPQVIGFDIYNHEEERYLSNEEATEVFEEIGIATAPIVDTKTVEEFDPENYEIPESNYRDGKMEGVVIINQDQEEDNRSGFNTRAKMVTKEFKEKHKDSTGARQSVEAVKGHEKIISKYCTDGRIRKHIGKMRDEGRDLGKELMGGQEGSEGLPIRVAVDIMEEEADEIVRRNDEMNWKNYRSLVADRCLRVIEEEMQKAAGGRP